MNKYTPTERDLIGTWVEAFEVNGSELSPHELEVEARRGVAKIKAEALRNAARALRRPGPGPYSDESGVASDERGNDGKAIDTWCASFLEERAERIERDET